MSYENRELSYQKTQSKQALKVFMGRNFLLCWVISFCFRTQKNYSTGSLTLYCGQKKEKLNFNYLYIYIYILYTVHLILLKKSVFLLFNLFLLLFIGLITLFGTIRDLIVLFQLPFNFIYSTFSKKNSVSTK